MVFVLLKTGLVVVKFGKTLILSVLVRGVSYVYTVLSEMTMPLVPRTRGGAGSPEVSAGECSY